MNGPCMAPTTSLHKRVVIARTRKYSSQIRFDNAKAYVKIFDEFLKVSDSKAEPQRMKTLAVGCALDFMNYQSNPFALRASTIQIASGHSRAPFRTFQKCHSRTAT
jgi:hypothetical protein